MKVKCKLNDGYPNLTIGKIYEVTALEPRYITKTFTFPRYVSVVDNSGNTSKGHAYRFEMLDGQNCEDYIKENIQDITEIEA